MNTQNFYERLGISRTATTEEIRKKWKQLIRQVHPDTVRKKMPNASEEQIKKALETANNTAQLINEAYETLRKPESRKRYDITLHYEESNTPQTTPHTQGYERPKPRYDSEDFNRCWGFSDFDRKPWQTFWEKFRSHRKRPQAGRNNSTYFQHNTRERDG